MRTAISPFKNPDHTQSELLRYRYKDTLAEIIHRLRHDVEMAALLNEAYPLLRVDLIERGLTCLQLQLYTLAFQLFDFALSLERDALACAAQADCLVGLQAWEEALALYKEVIALAPMIPDAYLRAAEIAMVCKMPEEACSLLAQLFQRPEWDSHPLLPLARRQYRFAQEALNAASSVPPPA